MTLAQAVAGNEEARKYIFSLLGSAAPPASSPTSSLPSAKRKRAAEDEDEYDLTSSALEATQYMDVSLVSIIGEGKEVEREAMMKLLDYGETLLERFPTLKTSTDTDPNGHRTFCFSFFKIRCPLTLL